MQPCQNTCWWRAGSAACCHLDHDLCTAFTRTHALGHIQCIDRKRLCCILACIISELRMRKHQTCRAVCLPMNGKRACQAWPVLRRQPAGASAAHQYTPCHMSAHSRKENR